MAIVASLLPFPKLGFERLADSLHQLEPKTWRTDVAEVLPPLLARFVLSAFASADRGMRARRAAHPGRVGVQTTQHSLSSAVNCNFASMSRFER